MMFNVLVKGTKIMRTKIYIIALLSVLPVAVSAQTYGTTYKPAKPAQREAEDVIQSQQIMMAGNTYNGTVYEPFSTAAPSDYSEVSTTSTTEESGRPGHIRKGFINPSDPGEQSEEFPIGEPWIMAVMAVVFGGVIYLRRRRAAVKR